MDGHSDQDISGFKQSRLIAASKRRASEGVEKAETFSLPDDGGDLALGIPNESARVTPEEFRQLLMSCVLTGASDVTIQTDQQVRGEIHGRLYRVTRRPWSPSEVDVVLTEIYGNASAQSEINGRRVLDFSYELNLGAGERQRFRVNATGIHGSNGAGVEITLRALPSATPTLEGVSLDETLMTALMPRDGIVVIAGATGSGKSTTMAAITRTHLENNVSPVKIVDIQAPIEYTFRDVTASLSGSASTIGQSEVGRHIDSFAIGVHSALRRKPNIINVGEARDFETITTSLEASLTGHLVYTTTHAGSVVGTMRRLLSVFPAEERESRSYDLLSGLRFIMVQHLAKRADKPGRVPVREYLEITSEIREQIVSTPTSEWPAQFNTIMMAPPSEGIIKQTLVDSIMPLYEAGVISKHEAINIGQRDVAQRILN